MLMGWSFLLIDEGTNEREASAKRFTSGSLLRLRAQAAFFDKGVSDQPSPTAGPISGEARLALTAPDLTPTKLRES
jgi:hypothetical protein